MPHRQISNGATQTGKPTFTEGDPNVPIDEDTPATFEDGFNH